MKLEKSPKRFNYKIIDIKCMKNEDYAKNLEDLLDKAGRDGWDLINMSEDHIIMKQTYFQKD